MTNEIVEDDSNKMNEFKKIYEELVDTLIYDDELGEIEYLEDGLDDLSAYEMVERSTNRISGGSLVFAMRVSKELSSLGIENYLMEDEIANEKYWRNLYKANDKWYVVDITQDIFERDSIKNELIKSNTLYADIEAIGFLFGKGKCSILEEIKDDGKKLEELQKKPISFIDIEENTVTIKEEKGLIVEEKTSIFEEIKSFFKDLFDKIKNIPERIEERKREKEEKAREEKVRKKEEEESARKAKDEFEKKYRINHGLENVAPEEIEEMFPGASKPSVSKEEPEIGD